MADNSVKFLTGSISDLQAKNTNGTPKVPIVPGRVYFAVDTDRNYGYIAYDVSASQRLVMSTRAELSDRVSHDLTLGDKSYNGSADVDILGSDLHRLSASNYLGITNTNITTSPGITTASVYIISEKKNKTAVVGNLVIYNNKEYYWSGGAGWKPVGAASFKLRQNPISSPSASSSTISFIDTISQDENGIITATKKTVRNATASQSGVVTTTEQTFGGLKIFNNGIKLGSNINMGDAGTPSSYPFIGNKITWTGGTDGAEIYYRLDSSDAGRLFLNMTDDTNALIALAYNGTAKSYINPSTPSFYPATSNTGSLGTSSNKWANIYATTIHGNLDGNASTATNATTATNLSAAGTWTWANGTTAGPTATLVLGGKTTNVGAIPSASTSQSGIITTGAQSFAGVKTFTNKIVLKDGNQAGAQIGAAYITTASATNGEVVLQNGHLRFGGSDWDYNQWAGLKYDHTNKKIVLGLADGSEFTANSAQSGGTFKLAGISTVDLNKTASIRNLAVGGGIYWNPYVESSSDGSDAASITVLNSGAAGGTELRIQQANDSTDIINLVSPYYIYFNSKQAFQINDSWLRINPNGGFSSGTLFSRLLRADAELQARDIGLYNANQFRTGRWYNVATGTAGDGSNSGTMGAVYLELGNGTAQSAASGAGGGNAKGYLRLYGSSTAVGTLEFDNTYFRPSADIYFVNNSSSTSGWANGIRGQVGANDYWRVGGGATGSNSGYMEIATADDANEPIYVRQYSGVFGTLNTTLTLLDASHNTIIPNALTVGTTTSQAANYKFYVNGTSYFNGNTTHNGIDYFANGTTYYINNSADANLRRGIFSGTSNGDTAASSFFNTGALEIREAGRVGNGQTSFNYAPRIGFHWSGRIAGSLSFHNDGIFYFRKQNGTDRATIDANVNGNSSTATQFASNKTITLSGDVSGSASSKGGWSITTSIGAGKVTNAMLAGSIENGKLINSKITLAGNDVNLGGSLSADTLRTSLGLSNALHFIGIATVSITDGSTTDPKISGYTTKTSGDVIIDKDSAYEYIWTGSKWERLGGDGSYKVVQSAVSSPSANGTEISFIDTISQNANGVISATKKTVRDASASQSGVVSTGAQSFAGNKTFIGNTRIQLSTPNLYLRDTNTNADTYAIMRFGNSSNENAAYIFLNGPSRTNDGGANMFTIRNNVGNLRLNNDTINTGKLTIGQANLNTSYTQYVNGISYFSDNISIKAGKEIKTVGTKATSSMIRFLDNTSDAYGNGISIGGGGVAILGAGESAISLNVSAGTETLYLLSDGAINIEANADTISNRIGLQITQSGNLIPVKAEATNNNAQSLGSSGNRWSKLFIGTTDSYGSATKPIYWNAGVPTICNSTLDINANGYATYLPNRYDGGDRPNPQQYFGQNIGFRIAMTRYAALTNDVTAWHDTMWVNGYNGNDVKNNTAITLIKNGTPRVFLSAQAYDATSYGKYYEVLSGYNIPYVYSSDIDYIPSERKFKLTRSSGSWVSHVYSKNGYNDGVSVSYKIDQTNAYIMVGLNSDPSTDANYTSLDYCWYTQSGGGLCIYENGSSISSITGHTTYSIGDTFKIEYSGGYIKYYHNGILCRTVARYKSTSKLYMDSSFHNSGSISNVKVTPISNLALTNFSSNTDIANYNTINTPSYIATVGLTGGAPATATKPSGIDNAFGILHAHLHSGNYSMQLGFGGTTNRLYYRNAYNTTTWTPWQTLYDSHHSIIPSSDLGYDIGSTSNKFNNAYLYTLHLRGASSSTMTNGTAPANPKIIFSENGGQQVGIVYTDHDAYRSSKGLKIMGTDGSDEGNVWLEVQGSIYTGGTISLNGQNANRLAWTDGNKILQAGYHYASSDRVAINSATAPSYNFYVNGTSYFNGIQYIQSNSSSSTTKGLTINNGVLSISNYNQTLSVGAQNTSWTHFETTGSQFYFNKQIHIDGNLTRYNYSGSGYGTISGYNLDGNALTTGNSWAPVTNGQTWSRICLLEPTGDSVQGYSGLLHLSCTRGNVVCNANFILNISHHGTSSRIVQIGGTNYSTFQVRIVTNSNSTAYVEIYDTAYSIATSTSQTWQATWVSFGYNNITKYTTFTTGATIPSGYAAAHTLNTTSGIVADKVYGAVWNDYAEYRQSDVTEPGRVVIENGDGTLFLSTKRLQRGAEIISDTYGFAIGETDECKTPIAATGRVLTYTYEPIEEYKSKIGWPVCSGPNGTVSIMSEEEEEKYPSRIIGTISEIPTYEEWGTGKVKVNGRVWIRIK